MFPSHMLFFPRNRHLRLRPYASAKQGHACLPCTSWFPAEVANSSLHESPFLHFPKPYLPEPSVQRCSYRLHNFHTQHTIAYECSLHFLSSPIRIKLQLVVCNVCQTQAPFSQTTTAVLSVGRPYTYTHVRNKLQCCYLPIFSLLSLLWNEKKSGTFLSEQPL
jgi:hypothetical protein